MVRYGLGILTLWLGFVAGQICNSALTPPITPSCSGGCLPLPPGPNVTLQSNTTYCVLPGEEITVNSINFDNNATLIVCGVLRVNGDLNIYGNNAELRISAGGSLQVSGNMNINSNTSVVNYGSTAIGGSLQLNGNNAAWWNVGTNSLLTVGGTIVLNASSRFYNIGSTIQAQELILNGNSNVCMRDGGCFSLKNLTVNVDASIQSSGANAIAYTGHATLNGTLTNSPDLYVCQAPGATVNNPSNWGSAQVVTNCTSGCGVLPAIALTVRTSATKAGLLVTWECAGCPKESAIYALRLISGASETLRHVKGLSHTFSSWELSGPEGLVEVRLLGQGGQILAQGVASWRYQETTLTFWPNAFREQLWVAYNGQAPIQLKLYDLAGALRWEGVINPGEQMLTLSNLTPGLYVAVGYAVDGMALGPYRLLRE